MVALSPPAPIITVGKGSQEYVGLTSRPARRLEFSRCVPQRAETSREPAPAGGHHKSEWPLHSPGREPDQKSGCTAPACRKSVLFYPTNASYPPSGGPE